MLSAEAGHRHPVMQQLHSSVFAQQNRVFVFNKDGYEDICINFIPGSQETSPSKYK